jgi:hypothetical protein
MRIPRQANSPLCSSTRLRDSIALGDIENIGLDRVWADMTLSSYFLTRRLSVGFRLSALG